MSADFMLFKFVKTWIHPAKGDEALNPDLTKLRIFSEILPEA